MGSGTGDKSCRAGGRATNRDLEPDAHSHVSFCFAASTVCHCMFDGASAPPRFSGTTWSITYPGHAPERWPVDGHGWALLKESFAASLRLNRPCSSRC